MILASLKQAGYKTTAARTALAEWIERHGKIFSAKEVLANIPGLDKVSVYRTLDLFSDLDLIHPVLSLHGEQHYELHGNEHHHHVVCEGCESADCIPCPIPNDAIQTTFTKIHHNLSYTGLCRACA